jgi:hypothetical protein
MAETTSTPSRRSMLAGLAVSPVAGLPAVASAFASDPALDALREYDRLHTIEQAAWDASSEANAIACTGKEVLNDVVFNGERMYSLTHLEVSRERSMGLTDDELEDTILRLRRGNTRKRAEGASLEREYQKARAILEAREAIPLARDSSAVVEAEERASDAQGETNEAQIAVFETEPTTPAGAIALLRFIGDFVDKPDVINDTTANGILGDVIRRAVDILERGALA